MRVKPSIRPGREFDRFKEILEKHFLNVDKGKIDRIKKDAFIRDLKLLNLNNSEILKNFIYYFDEIFRTAQLKTTDRPLHVSRDFALELFAEVFSDLVSGVTGIGVTKTEFLMFLVGIIDDPNSSSPVSGRIELIAKSDEPVLITGGTGTGKELHAKVIHYRSSRWGEPFIALNCAGIVETLLESELFGHEKGSFTGADRRKIGFMKTVGEGTLFLDEIGDMPPSMQAKLLRVLQYGDFFMVGGKERLWFRGRVIAATNKDLKAIIKKPDPEFRPDLFYRLNVLPISLPSLRELPDRERETAILNKLRHIIYSKSKEPGDWSHMAFLSSSGGPGPCIDNEGEMVTPDNPFISDEALQLLVNYDFPGNYRELENIIRAAYIFSRNDKIEVPALPDEVRTFNRSESLQGEGDASSVDTICLKDIVDHAEKTKKDIVRRKVESVYRSGRNMKGVLESEGIAGEKSYQRIRKRVVGIIGQEEMSHIRKG